MWLNYANITFNKNVSCLTLNKVFYLLPHNLVLVSRYHHIHWQSSWVVFTSKHQVTCFKIPPWFTGKILELSSQANISVLVSRYHNDSLAKFLSCLHKQTSMCHFVIVSRYHHDSLAKFLSCLHKQTPVYLFQDTTMIHWQSSCLELSSQANINVPFGSCFKIPQWFTGKVLELSSQANISVLVSRYHHDLLAKFLSCLHKQISVYLFQDTTMIHWQNSWVTFTSKHQCTITNREAIHRPTHIVDDDSNEYTSNCSH